MLNLKDAETRGKTFKVLNSAGGWKNGPTFGLAMVEKTTNELDRGAPEHATNDDAMPMSGVRVTN